VIEKTKNRIIFKKWKVIDWNHEQKQEYEKAKKNKRKNIV